MKGGKAMVGEFYRKLGKRIKELRERLGISQQSLSALLGVSRTAISQIENGDRKVSTDELVKLSDIFNLPVEWLLNAKKEPEVILNATKKKELAKAKIRINVPQRNVEKFKEVLLYILDKVGSKSNIGETVIYKLLYFIDFDYYEKYEEQLIGARYIKNNFGPTPLEFDKIVSEMIEKKETTKVTTKYYDYDQIRYLAQRKPDLSKLNGNEIEVINDVLNRLSNMNATQISDYSHNDVPWLTTEEQEIIEYESVFYRTPAYSVREYSEEDIPGDRSSS